MFSFFHRSWWVGVMFSMGAMAPALAQGQTHGRHAPIEQSSDWREANDIVGQFERGHIDILQWEAEHLPSPTAPPSPDTPVWRLSEAIVSAQRLRPEWIARPGMSPIERTQLQLQQRQLALDVERAWWTAVSAQAKLSSQRQILLAAEVSHELAQRMARVGNWPQAREQREHLGHLHAQALLRAAEHEARAAVLALWTLTGAPKEPDALAAHLPQALPPAEPRDFDTIDIAEWERQALTRHPEWALRQRLAQTALDGLGDMSALQTAIEAATAPDASSGVPQTLPAFGPTRWPHSWEKAWEDQLKAQALERRIRRDIRMAVSAWEAARLMAMETTTQAEALMSALEEDMLQRYNGMFKSTWDLLSATRSRLEAAQATQQAHLTALLAYADLRAVLDGLPYTGQMPGVASTAAAADKGH